MIAWPQYPLESGINIKIEVNTEPNILLIEVLPCEIRGEDKVEITRDHSRSPRVRQWAWSHFEFYSG